LIDELAVETRDGLLCVTLNRPQKANALTLEMLQALTRVLSEARADASVHGVLLAGAGGRVFSGGVDVRQTSTLPEAEFRLLRSQTFFALLLQLIDCEKPVAAAVNGMASGGGFMMALLADVIVASDTAAFALPEIDLDMPALAGLAIIAPLAGGALAADLVQSGRRMNADEALRHGLVRVVTQGDKVDTEAERIVRELMAKSPRAFVRNKQWSRAPMRVELERAEREMVAYRSVK
jgi:enoyl-CoA hydratase/carnithine racemase